MIKDIQSEWSRTERMAFVLAKNIGETNDKNDRNDGKRSLIVYSYHSLAKHRNVINVKETNVEYNYDFLFSLLISYRFFCAKN